MFSGIGHINNSLLMVDDNNALMDAYLHVVAVLFVEPDKMPSADD